MTYLPSSDSRTFTPFTPFTPVIHAFPGPVVKSDAEKIAIAEQNSSALHNQFVNLTAQVQEAENELSEGVNFPERAKKLVELRQKLAAVDKRWGESQTLVNTLHQELDKANQDRREWNRDQQQQVAAAAAAKDAAIAAAQSEKLDKARDDYEKELQKYMDVVRYVHSKKQKEWVGWAYSFLPSSPFGKKNPAWQLDEGDDENKMKEKYWLLHEEIQKYYKDYPFLKDISFETLKAVRPQPPPRSQSPPPQGRGGKSRRRTKKGKGNGKGKNARPCRRSTCRRSTRRH
jgi:hypothetical protein